MSVQGLTLAVAVGAALIALWLEVRVRRFEPHGAMSTFLHVGASFVLISAVPPMMVAVVDGTDSPARKLVALFLLAFPALVYMFLSIVWFLKLAQSMLRLR